MGARPAWLVAGIALASASASAGDPKPTAVDIKPFRDRLIVLQDAQGATYVVDPGSDGHAFYGTGKALYEQIITGRSAQGDIGAWDVDVFAPRVPELRPGVIQRRGDGTYHLLCDRDDTVLTERTGDKAKAIVDKSQFLTPAVIRTAHFLARDETGVYYYVDQIRKAYGGKGYRVFVGKKGAMKELPLVDIAMDSAGDIFSTKTGDLRLVNDRDASTAKWVRGDKAVVLKILDLDVNSPLIYRDLGVYSFIGTICENL